MADEPATRPGTTSADDSRLARAQSARVDEPHQVASAPDPDVARVVRSFVRKGRIVDMPAGQAKRLILLRWLRDECFGEDRAYSEPEVNERLGAYWHDFAAVRRYMIDAGLLTRSDSGSEYRRGTER